MPKVKGDFDTHFDGAGEEKDPKAISLRSSLGVGSLKRQEEN